MTQNQLILTALFLVGFHQYTGLDFFKIKDQLAENKTESDVVEIRAKLGEIIIKTFNIA